MASLGKGSWAVADAAGNDLLRIDPRGTVSVIKVLPRQPFTITAADAAAVHLPACVVGAVYNFEPVPTDVEVGPDGWLYSSTLPGGPEDGSFGARGSVYRVDPANSHYRRLATGFAGATNLAVTPDGSVYVAELIAGDIAKVSGGKAQRYLSLPNALSLVAGNGHVYAGTLAPSDSHNNPPVRDPSSRSTDPSLWPNASRRARELLVNRARRGGADGPPGSIVDVAGPG